MEITISPMDDKKSSNILKLRGNNRPDLLQQYMRQLFVTIVTKLDTSLEDVLLTTNLNSQKINYPPCDGSRR